MVSRDCQQNVKTLDKSFKLNYKEAIRPTPVINLSNQFLTNSEIDLLSKGLKYIPKPYHSDRTSIDEGLAASSRRTKLTLFFHYEGDSVNPKKTFCHKSKWTPSDKSLGGFADDIANHFSKLGEDVNNIKLEQHKQNMSKVDYRALKSLKNRKNIVIKPADKGSSTVVLNKSEYINDKI